MNVPSPAELRRSWTSCGHGTGDRRRYNCSRVRGWRRPRFREPCRQLVAAIQRGDVTATTTAEVIQEFAHVRARRRTLADAVRLSDAYATILSPPLVVEEADLRTGLGLFQQHAELGALDAVLAAAAIAVEATALLSANSGFAAVQRLPRVVPDSEGIQRVLI